MAADDTTKECPCTICGEMVTVTKFATAAKVKCVECKKEIRIRPIEERNEENFAEWGDVNDRELRNLCCLSCGEDLVLINLIKSDKWGDILRLQCPCCFLTIQISEQGKVCKKLMKRVPINRFAGTVNQMLVEDIAHDIDIDVVSPSEEVTEYIKDRYSDNDDDSNIVDDIDETEMSECDKCGSRDEGEDYCRQCPDYPLR